MLPRYLIVSFIVSLSMSTPVWAENPAQACNEAATLAAEGDIEGALEEARWCVESLQQVKQNATAGVFPDEIAGFRGGEVDQQAAMGMSIINRVYNRDGRMIDVSLTQGGAGGGLAAIAQMGMSMGAGQKMRIQRYTVMDMSEGSDVELSVPLKNGALLGISSTNVDKDTVVTFLEAFPIAELDQ